MTEHVLLVEIGTEELPSKMLFRFGESFAKNIESEFKSVNIIYEKVIWFASSRRLAVKVNGVVFDSYINVDNKDVKKDLSMVVRFNNRNQSLLDKHYLCNGNVVSLLYSTVHSSLIKLSASFLMKWERDDVRFIRPVRTVTVLLDDKVVTCNFFGIDSGRIIRGHHFMGDNKIVLDHAENYQEILLKKGFVVVDYEQRRNIIRCGIENVAKKVGGLIDYTGYLLEEVTALSEWPVVLYGSFDNDFLCIPNEILLYIMKVQKKYFPLYDSQGKLLPHFVFVIDIVTERNQQIILSHEKVLRLSFSEVMFFLNSDKKHLLEQHRSRLHTVCFHKKLGNLYDKSIRIKNLSSWVASRMGIDIRSVERAAILSKCDLLSNMVSEFPFSQGIMGMHYALRDGESEEVALAQKEQYQPRFASDLLPSSLLSCAISIADKIDTLSGMFMIGECPKGKGDPMGLRRVTIGILRIIIEKRISLNLWDLVEYSLNLYNHFSSDGLVRAIINFMYKRLCVLYKNKGYKIEIIRASVSDTLVNLSDFDKRISAISDFCLSKEAQLLFSMYKRIFNILQGVSELCDCKLNDSLLIQKEEIFLSKKILIFDQELKKMCELGIYYDALNLLVGLCIPIDEFFRNVIVMVDNKDIRMNRLILLYKVWSLLLNVIKIPHHIFNMSLRV